MVYYNLSMYDDNDKLMHDMAIKIDESGYITDITGCYTPDSNDCNCKGLVAYPSFMDSAVILPSREIFDVDLSDCNTLDDYIIKIESCPNEILRAFGYNSMVLGAYGAGEIKTILDTQYPNSPAYVISDTTITVIVNNFILDKVSNWIEVTDDLRECGELDYLEFSIIKTKTDIFSFDEDRVIQSLLSFQKEMLQNGITTIRIIDSLVDVVTPINKLCESEEWQLITIVDIPVYSFETEKEMLDRYSNYMSLENSKLFVMGVSILLDGSIDSAQAYLFSHYEHLHNWCGDSYWRVDRLSRIVSVFIDLGVDVNIRAHGDKAFSMAMFAFSGCDTSFDKGNKILTHAYLVTEDDMHSCAKYGVTVCVELNAIPYAEDYYCGDLLMLGDRCKSEYPVGRFIYRGVTLVAGSNYPAQQDINPIHGAYKATHRVSRDDVTIWGALSMYVDNPLQLNGLHSRLGSLQVGKLGNFVLLNKDIIHMNESYLMDVKCMATVVNGKMYRR